MSIKIITKCLFFVQYYHRTVAFYTIICYYIFKCRGNNIMVKNISFDIAALLLLLLILLSCIIRKMTNGIPNRLFLILVSFALSSTAFDIWAVSLDNAGSTNLPALYAAHTGYLLTHSLVTSVYLLFEIALTDTWHKLGKSFLLQFLLWAPCIAVTALLVTNPFTGWIFTVENGYTRGPGFSVLYITTIIHSVYFVAYLSRYHKLFTRFKLLTISSYLPIGITAMVIQMLQPSLLVEMFAGALSILLISIGVQRPEDVVDSATLLMKHSAYASDMKRTFYNHKHVTIVMLNIGNYASIHSMMGYDFAIQVLEVVASRIREVNKHTGGKADLYYLDTGRFRMVFNRKYYENAADAAHLLMDVLKSSDFSGLDIDLMPYIVLARCPEDIGNFDSLMRLGADFHIRNQFSGTVMTADEAFSKNTLEIQNHIDEIINRGFQNHSFQVYYQPIYSIEHDAFVSAEALLRLFDEKHGFISPEILIPAAEKSGAIHKIGAFVFEEVCRFISSDNFKLLNLKYIEVNLSVAQCMHRDLADNILTTMHQYHVPSDKINLEITETAAANTQKIMTENLNKLNAAGISFSLDDYGTGYSNMKRVIQLPLKIIKLDKSFVDEQHNPKMWIFLQNTVKMIKDMEMEIVVEGIETEEMLRAFTDLKCDFIQGYFFSKPIPEADFVKFISNAQLKSQQS